MLFPRLFSCHGSKVGHFLLVLPLHVKSQVDLLAVHRFAAWLKAAKNYPIFDRLVGLLVAFKVGQSVETSSTNLVK